MSFDMLLAVLGAPIPRCDDMMTAQVLSRRHEAIKALSRLRECVEVLGLDAETATAADVRQQFATADELKRLTGVIDREVERLAGPRAPIKASHANAITWFGEEIDRLRAENADMKAMLSREWEANNPGVPEPDWGLYAASLRAAREDKGKSIEELKQKL